MKPQLIIFFVSIQAYTGQAMIMIHVQYQVNKGSCVSEKTNFRKRRNGIISIFKIKVQNICNLSSLLTTPIPMNAPEILLTHLA
jgi:hypothetical protein